jgi:hypothetical protein
MAAKKKAKKKAAVTRKSPLYALTNKKFPEDLGGQGLLIHDALEKLQPATTAQLAEAVSAKLETRQKPTTVVSFYMGAWKKDGLVKVAKSGKPQPVAA